jgi:hypothetical protein
VRKVAKAAYPKSEQKQFDWVKIQQQLLKKSQWQTVIQNSQSLKRRTPKTRMGIPTKVSSTRHSHRFSANQNC